MSNASLRALPISSAPVFAALGDPTRLEIVHQLGREGPASIVKLAASSRVTRQAIAKHLAVLEDAGLVSGKRDGRERVFTLEPRRFAEATKWLEAIASQWDAAIERLRAHVEE
jgi:DNA-binding transcriptional ArsR family regulator